MQIAPCRRIMRKRARRSEERQQPQIKASRSKGMNIDLDFGSFSLFGDDGGSKKLPEIDEQKIR